MTIRSAFSTAGACALLGACTVMPTGPSVMALPGSQKSMGQYQGDAVECRHYADSVIATVAGSTAANADNQAASSAAAGAAIGAVTGAVIGAATGEAGHGAAIGAGTGLLFGAAAGSPHTSLSSYQLQRGYDSAYLQCMYARGHQVPVARRYANGPVQPVYVKPKASVPPPPPAATGYPPPVNVPPSSYPPPGTPPPPDTR